MADTRGLKVNKDIYKFEEVVYRVYDNLPVKHRHTLSETLITGVQDMRLYTNLACRMYKGCLGKKTELFSLASGYAENVQDSLNHLYDLGFLSDKAKSALDVSLYEIREQLSRLVNSFEKQLTKGSVHREYANDGEPLYQEEG